MKPTVQDPTRRARYRAAKETCDATLLVALQASVDGRTEEEMEIEQNHSHVADHLKCYDGSCDLQLMLSLHRAMIEDHMMRGNFALVAALDVLPHVEGQTWSHLIDSINILTARAVWTRYFKARK